MFSAINMLADFVKESFGQHCADYSQTFLDLCLLIGTIYLAVKSVSLVTALFQAFKTFILSIFWPRNFKKEYGQWAGTIFFCEIASNYLMDIYIVVTGCTRGIGLGYVYALTKHGMNIVLIGRDRQRMEQISKEIG